MRHDEIPSGGINFGVEIQNLARVEKLSAGRSSVVGLKPDYRTRTATVGGTGRVGTVMDGFHSVVVGTSLVREGQHADRKLR